MSDRQRNSTYSFLLLFGMVLVLFFLVRTDYYQIRDLQHRIVILEQRCK